jgi:hypothetical protein
VFVDVTNGTRFALVNIETAMIFHEVKLAAIEMLQTRFGSLYNMNNTMISATHTVSRAPVGDPTCSRFAGKHSGPGGFTYFPLYDITTLGYQEEALKIIANGIAQAITQAHDSIVANAVVKFNVDELVNPQTNIKCDVHIACMHATNVASQSIAVRVSVQSTEGARAVQARRRQELHAAADRECERCTSRRCQLVRSARHKHEQHQRTHLW